MEPYYYIPTSKDEEKCIKITFSEYEALRNKIMDRLQTVYDSLDCMDADYRNISILIVGTKDTHQCVNAFNVEKWVEHLNDGSFDQEINKQLEWCSANIKRALDTDIKFSFKHG